jgi:hypothetical protein
VRRRFNTSSLEDMIDLSGVAGEDAVPWIFRRIGDIALFQSGVFPLSLRPSAARGARARAIPPTLATYEEHGRRFYRLSASRAADQPSAAWGNPGPGVLAHAAGRGAGGTSGGSQSRVLEALAEEFPAARKSLELLSDRYLRWSPIRWFPGFD